MGWRWIEIGYGGYKGIDGVGSYFPLHLLLEFW